MNNSSEIIFPFHRIKISKNECFHLLNGLFDVVGAAYHARGRSTELYKIFPDFFAVKHGIKSCNFIYTHRIYINDLCHLYKILIIIGLATNIVDIIAVMKYISIDEFPYFVLNSIIFGNDICIFIIN